MTDPLFSFRDFFLGRLMNLWRWVAVFACNRLNARLEDFQHTYVVTMTGEPRDRGV